jgi:hypothetical protein
MQIWYYILLKEHRFRVSHRKLALRRPEFSNSRPNAITPWGNIGRGKTKREIANVITTTFVAYPVAYPSKNAKSFGGQFRVCCLLASSSRHRLNLFIPLNVIMTSSLSLLLFYILPAALQITPVIHATTLYKPLLSFLKNLLNKLLL